MTSGIYIVRHIATGRCYIGSSINVPRRLKRHASRLRAQKHTNPALQNAWNKHGELAFEFRQLIVCRRQELTLYENLAISAFRANVKPYGYNSRVVADSCLGMPSAKMSHSPGDKYNRMTLVKKIDGPGGKNRWLCKCDCGKDKVTYAASLRSGLIRSCGCIKTETLQTNRAHYAGERYGRLELVSRLGVGNGGMILWRCRCDCGAEVELAASRVARGKVRSCGCLRRDVVRAAAIKRNAARAGVSQ